MNIDTAIVIIIVFGAMCASVCFYELLKTIKKLTLLESNRKDKICIKTTNCKVKEECSPTIVVYLEE